VIEPRSATLSLVALVLALSTARPTGAQDPAEDEWTVSPEAIEFARNAPIFQSDALLELTLSSDFRTLRREDRGEAEPQRRDATLAFTTADGSPLTLEIRVEARGNWRRNPRNCAFPPLWIDLDKDDEALGGTVFEGQNRLKLVLPCRPGNGAYEEYVYKEYLVYPAYNVLTEASFRARPARITIVDTSGGDDPFTANAFVLEHKDQMAARNEAVPIELTQLHPALAAQEEAAVMEVFNYMIGMTDYTGAFMHNVEPVRHMDGRMILVPYDFDWSGTVNARYASPDPSLPIRNVRQRVFQGMCRDVDYASIFARFIERREAILGVVRDFTHLDEDRREEIVEYWEAFFEMAADPRRQERILRDCTAIPS
jgi:hypothetical protein